MPPNLARENRTKRWRISPILAAETLKVEEFHFVLGQLRELASSFGLRSHRCTREIAKASRYAPDFAVYHGKRGDPGIRQRFEDLRFPVQIFVTQTRGLVRWKLENYRPEPLFEYYVPI
jgi:hypothetical protein